MHVELASSGLGSAQGRRPPAKEGADASPAEFSVFRHFFELSVDLLCVLDTEGSLRALNHAWERVLEYGTSELVDRPLLDVVHPEDRQRTAEALAQMLGPGDGVAAFECRCVAKGGRVRHLEWTAHLVVEDGRAYAVARDITEKGQERPSRGDAGAAEQLRLCVAEQARRLEDARRELETFTHSVSHDLKAPLRAIDGFTRILLEEHQGMLDGEAQRLCSIIRDNTGKLGRFIDELLALSRLGRAPLAAACVDMRALVASVFSRLTTAEARARIELRVDALPEVVADPTLMGHVWTELLANALKFSARRERAVIEVGGEVQAEELVYFVRDNGAGFDMRYLSKLFGIFQRLHAAREFEGDGVGLAVVHKAVTRHGGRVWAEGRPDRGATFWFSLPRGSA